MATLPQFKQRELARRSTSDVQRLASQYKSGVQSLTDEYQKAFAAYQADVSLQMSPFEAAMTQYKTVQMPAFEAAQAEYRKALDAYQAQLADIEANPTIKTNERYTKYAGLMQTIWDEEPRPIPQFTAVMPKAPEAPKAPTIAAFNEQPFEQKKKTLQEEYSREVGERRASRMSVATRRSARPLLQGG